MSENYTINIESKGLYFIDVDSDFDRLFKRAEILAKAFDLDFDRTILFSEYMKIKDDMLKTLELEGYVESKSFPMDSYEAPNIRYEFKNSEVVVNYILDGKTNRGHYCLSIGEDWNKKRLRGRFYFWCYIGYGIIFG